MPEKYKSPWRLKEFLKANNPDEVLSLSWKFRLELLERTAKILSDLHRKNRAYGFGSLTSEKVLIQASDRYGLEVLDKYPPIVAINKGNEVPSFTEQDGTYAKLDQLCFGIVVLELLTQRPLNGKQLPQLVGLLKRKGLGHVEISLGSEKLKKISHIKEKDLTGEQGLKQKAKEELVKREMIKEDLKRKDYDPEPQSRAEEVELFRNELEAGGDVKPTDISTKEVKKETGKNGSVRVSVKQSNRVKKTQIFMSKLLKNAQQGLSKLSKGFNKRRKEMQFPKWANFQRIYIPRLEQPVGEDGRVSRNLIREKDVIERKVDEELENKKGKRKTEMDDYVMSSIIKDEIKAYLNPTEETAVNKLKKPAWLLNLHELTLQLLTSVDDSRPSAKATRNWLLEILQSFEKNAKKHENVKQVISKPDFQDLSQSVKNVRLNLTGTMNKADYVTNVHLFDLMYKGLPAEEILAEIEPVKGEVFIYHSKDVVGEYLDSDDEDNISVDSHQPEPKKPSDLKELKKEIRSSLLVMESATGNDTEFVMENEPPPIFGPNADKLLQRMEKQRVEVGEIMKPSEVAKLFDEQKKLPHHQVVSLLKKAREILDKEPNILSIDAPVIVVGDIHGQYFDLRQVMKFCGKPKRAAKKLRSAVSTMSVNSQVRKSRFSRKSKRKSKNSVFNKIMRKSSAPEGNDSLVFNKAEFIKEMSENGRPKSKTSKYTTGQIAEGVVPQPLTKTMTLGRTLEGVEGQKSPPPATPERPKTKSLATDSEKGKSFLFLGDYIDRGSWSCEVLFYLLSMKVHYPDTVIMLRGNHECDTMAETYGFREECEHKYGREVYHRCVQVFSCLPIACLINLPNGKRLLGCHGGFSDKISTLEQIAKVERRREPGIEGILCDLLWSDPVPDNVVEEYKLPMAFENIDFIPNETRGCAKKFGYRALERFLTNNQLVGIVRAHEAKEEGFQFHFQNAGTKNHLCITVFSAPNYMNEHGNKGAVLLIHRTVKDRLMHQMKRLKYKYTVEQILRQPDRSKDDYLDLMEPICYNEVVQPQVVAFDNQNMTVLQQIEETCPYMPTIIDEFYNSALDILDNYGDAQKQLETYRREQNLKKLEAEKELEENKKAKKKIKFQMRNGQKQWHSVKFGTASFKKLKNMRKHVSRSSVRKSAFRGSQRLSQRNSFRSSTRFDKSMKKVNEQHPHFMQEKLRKASSRLEQMENTAMKAQTDDELVLQTTSSRSLGVNNLATVKRGRALSAGASPEEKAEIMRSARLSKKKISLMKLESDNDVSEAEEDNNAVVTQIQNRQFMKRERIEIDFKEEWMQLLSCWFSFLAGEEIFPEALFEELADCVLLCQAASAVTKNEQLRFYKPKLNSELSPFEIRRNLIVFQDCCKDLGIQYMFLIYDLKNHEYNYVLPSLIELVKRAKKENVLHLAYDPEFPDHLYNQEIGKGVNAIPDDAKDEDLKDKGLEVGAVTFNGEERLMLQLLFLMNDFDDSGLITARSIIEWAREEGKLIRPEHAEKVISAIDYDNDGAIGLRDFFQYAAKLKEEFLSEEFEEYDDEYDDDIDDEEDLLLENQQIMSDDFIGEGDEGVFNPTEAFDLSHVQLNMGTEEET